ncbi:hypothetical protein [Evansella tamaricis]|uniref:Amidase n=1 Tax=Evansella tamaricis TaxID=2069301 RepID=A0ABS6JLA7_9BACI|nr:hypothetical protein [Evansella tamaricis]MBU9713994.1 hypothetical protein [Evansella tamaricis]
MMKKIINITVIVLAVFISFACSSEERGGIPLESTWLWDASLIESEESTEKVRNFLHENNVETVYLQVDRNISYESYRKFIKTIKELGISVHALDGTPTWGPIEHQTFIRWLTGYQQSTEMDGAFDGIHLDIEPYLRDDWEGERNDVIAVYQESILQMLEEAKHLNLSFGADIPFWFDEIEYRNGFGEGKLAHWLIDKVDNITIMAYRTESEGENGIIDIVSQEMEWANEMGKNIIIAVETVPLPEEYITFYGSAKEELEVQLGIVKERYEKDSAFSGFAIHHLFSWMEME